ncbi:MFS transporter [Notoacmeibacter sp. MSK16QG-6]|uniref:MFS transporter n=1 Tax=Notoacmeibacter sp. MSK16QG-6 TaxID=2957982 RepID=UPI00209E2727|nr:MFS transporter [Notoacmeibacter sp. MSK16QG-6]MCP1199415.1 MFS transporter [Notoacmeibacter sp. MSK16QG-6]
MVDLIVLGAAYVLSQFYRSFLAVLVPALKSDLGASDSVLSVAAGAFFVVFALSQFGVGVALDRYGPKRTASTILLFAGGGGAMLFALATEPFMIVIAMGLLGLGCSPVLMATTFLFARRFDPARLALLMSVFIGIGSAGNVVGTTPLALAAEAYGWRYVVGGLGIVTIATAGLTFLLVRDPPRLSGSASSDGIAGTLRLLKIRALWPVLLMSAVVYSPAANIRGLWTGPYLAEGFGADAILIGNVTLAMAIAMVIGSVAYGPMDTLFRTRKWVVLGGNLPVLAALAFLGLWVDISIMSAAMLFFTIGLFGAAYGVVMAHGRAFVPEELTGRGVTLINFFSIGGAGLLQWLSGGIAATVPSDSRYEAVFVFYAIVLASGLFLYLFARDARPRS